MTPICLPGRRPQTAYLKDDPELFTLKTTLNCLLGIRPQTVYLEDNPKLVNWKTTTRCLPMTLNYLPWRRIRAVSLKYDPKLFTLKTTSNCLPGIRPQTVNLEDDFKQLPERRPQTSLYRVHPFLGSWCYTSLQAAALYFQDPSS